MAKFYLYLSRFTLILLVFAASSAFGQTKTVTGTVTSSDDGAPLPGVNVQIKGSNTGTVTDVEGRFSLTASSSDVLVFSFVGYASSEVTVGEQTNISIVMATDVTALSEVVVIGYGSVRVKDATGAVAAVSAADFNMGLISSPEQLIQGKTAGVQITSTSGEPGGAVNIRIRGTNSIRSNNNPLFVVDGVPLSGGTQPGAGDIGFGSQQDANPLNFLNPNDIESISILKDASATAIYGSRGANGVVMITTKNGKGGGKGVFELASSVSISSPANEYDLLSAEEFLAALPAYGNNPATEDFGANTDWQDYITRTSVSNTQNLSYSKGFTGGSVRASFAYDNQIGIMENSEMRRLTGRVNANKSFLDNKLNLDLNSTFSNVKREDPAIGASAGFQGDILGAAYSANPTWPTDPTFDQTDGQRSPAQMLEYVQNTGKTNRFLNNLSVGYKINNALSAKATYGMDISIGERLALLSGLSSNISNNALGYGRGQYNENKTTSNLVELTMTYNKKVGNVSMEIVGGYSFQSFRNKYFWTAARGFTDFENFGRMETELMNSYDAADAAASKIFSDYNNWGVADVLTGSISGSGGFVSGLDVNSETDFHPRALFARPAGVTVDAIIANFYDQTDFLQSYFARGNFTISDKYLVSASLRIDGSSKFGPDNQYGVFPSGAVAWKLDQEDFMPDVFSTMKFRVGYGIVGNQDGLGYGNFRRRDRYADASINDNREAIVPGIRTDGYAEPGLKWEQTSQLSIGLDFGIIQDKLSGSFDVYVKNTTDLLLKANAAQPAQAPIFFTNLDATVENKGWELSLSYVAIDNQDASFTISGNVAHNENMLKDFAGALDAGTIRGQGLSLAYAQRLAGGHPLFSYHLREFEGFDDNGQPIGDNQTFVGKSALPTWNMGLSLNGRYKAFDMAVYFSGQFGHYVYSNTRNAFFTAGSIQSSRNVTKDVLTSGEAGTAEAAVSTRFLESGDFVRMQNFTVGYTVPLGEMKFLRKLRFYVTGQNLFVITDYSGLDPEVSSSPANFDLLNELPTAGIDYTAYPRPRTFTIGLNASF